MYNTTAPLTNNVTPVVVPACTTPGSQPSALELSATNNSISGFFMPVTGMDGYLVAMSTSSTASTIPQNGVVYTTGNTIGNTTVIYNGTANGFLATGLNASTTYYFWIYAKNDQCTGGPFYRTTDPLSGATTTTATAPFNHYFGNLHSHTSFSDGNKDNTLLTPADAYTYAKTSQCMDFLGISEHNHNEAGMELANYSTGINAATTATTSTFLGLYGMEWGVISNGGHVLVYGINQLIGWEAGNYNIFVPKSDYLGLPSTTGTTGLFKTINDWPTTAFAMLAHPDNSDFGNIANTSLNATADSAIAGVAIESGPAFSTSTTYNDLPTRLSHYSYYKRLLSRGYRVGPSIDHDNHYTNFGRTNYSRLAVLSANLTQATFLQSVKDMRYYATHDCDVRVNFTLNNVPMGGFATSYSPPLMNVQVTDPTNPSAVATIRIMHGITGSGLLPVVIDSIVGNTFSFADYNLPTNSNAYYFAEISISGGYAITAPVWFFRHTGVSPVTLLSFTAKAVEVKKVQLNWSSVNEYNNDGFVIEHSTDGVNFKPIGFVRGLNSTTRSNYVYLHNNPVAGLNYYRLKQMDTDGKFTYSAVVTAKISQAPGNITIFPNPVKEVLKLKLTGYESASAQVLITDVNGKLLKTYSVNMVAGEQLHDFPVNELSSGVYFLVLRYNTDRKVTRFVKD